jgi:hypothetical protein
MIMYNGFKMFSFRCTSYVQEIILLKNMFSCPLKLILGFSRIFYVFDYKQKYSYTIMYGLKELWLNQMTHIHLMT